MKSRLIYGIFAILVWHTCACSFESNPRLTQIISKPGVQKLNKTGTEFAIADLHYEITLVADDRVGAVQVMPYKNSPPPCLDQARDSAKKIVEQLGPLGSDLGREPLEVIPTSGKRRYNWKYENAVEVVSLYRKGDACDLFDRLTFFYWVSIKGKIKSKHISSVPDLSGAPLGRFAIVVKDKELELSENDFRSVKEKDVVEVEYLLNNSLARIIRSTTP
jgi:hypothetical protein